MANLKATTPIIAMYSCAVLLIFTAFPAFMASSAPANPDPAPKVKTDAGIRAILEKWRDKIKPTLPAAHVVEIEKHVASFPVNAPEGVFPISYEDSENESDVDIRPKPNRRDWAFAMEGFLYTFLGGHGVGQEAKLDIGFWCFIEAALIHLTPDHLASVAFHLNERGGYDDAISILTCVKSLNPYHFTARNNLAYSYSANGNSKAAYVEMSQAAFLKPHDERYQRKLKFYADKAGINTTQIEAETQQAPAPSKAYADTMIALMAASREFYMEFMHIRWNTLFHMCFSSGPASAMSRDYQRMNDSHIASEQCSRNCYPASGVIPAGIRKCICACNIAGSQSNYSSGLHYYNEIRPICEKWEKESLGALDFLVEAMADLLIKNKNGLETNEIDSIEAFITDTYISNQEAIRDLHKTYIDGAVEQITQRLDALKRTSEDCGKALSASETVNPMDYFGKRPPKIRRVSDAGKVWTIWFFFGDLKLYPDDTAKLSIGLKGVASAKLKYNFRTGDHGAGVAVGLNLGKAFGPVGESVFKTSMKFEFFAFSDSKEGLTYGLETGIRPKIGVSATNPNDLVVGLQN